MSRRGSFVFALQLLLILLNGLNLKEFQVSSFLGSLVEEDDGAKDVGLVGLHDATIHHHFACSKGRGRVGGTQNIHRDRCHMVRTAR